MGDEIKINTTQVAETGVSILTENTTLSYTVENTRTSVNRLLSTWKAHSADSVIPRFHTSIDKHYPNTFDTVKRYAEFLQNYVSQGYTQTETDNTDIGGGF